MARSGGFAAGGSDGLSLTLDGTGAALVTVGGPFALDGGGAGDFFRARLDCCGWFGCFFVATFCFLLLAVRGTSS